MGFNSGFKGLIHFFLQFLTFSTCFEPYGSTLGRQLVVNAVFVYYFHSRTVYFDIIKVLSPTDAQENCFKRSHKIYIKTAPTCFGVITIIRERTIGAC